MSASPGSAQPMASAGPNSSPPQPVSESAQIPVLEYNILLLGEKGVGKSTTINAIANYFEFGDDFSAAKLSTKPLIEAIPFKFVLPKATSSDTDRQGTFVVQSATYEQDTERQQRVFSFKYTNNVIRLIDTPSFEEHSLTEDGKPQFDAIFDQIRQYNQIHAIFVLIKSTMTSVGASFRALLTELFSRLPAIALGNVYFCVTFSRLSRFEQGDAFATLIDLINTEFEFNTKHMEETLPPHNHFGYLFLDNESFRYLAAIKQGYSFGQLEEKRYEKSWNYSTDQIKNLFLDFLSNSSQCKPLETNTIGQLDNAKRMLSKVVNVIDEMQKEIGLDLAVEKIDLAKIEAKDEEQDCTEKSEQEHPKTDSKLIQNGQEGPESEIPDSCSGAAQLELPNQEITDLVPVEDEPNVVEDSAQNLSVESQVEQKKLDLEKRKELNQNYRLELVEAIKVAYKLVRIIQENSGLVYCNKFLDAILKTNRKLISKSSSESNAIRGTADKLYEQLLQLEHFGAKLRQLEDTGEECDRTSFATAESDHSKSTERLVIEKNDIIPMMRNSLSPVPEYNILLFGETGSGKSTTINAIANYLKYTCFEDANSTGEFIELIPSEFSMPNPETGQTILIESGKNLPTASNEKFGKNQSATQEPRGYKFQFGKGLIRLIDTPGIGDTAGLGQDKINFEMTLNYLSNLTNLHGICILLRATETRKTTFFSYCISELLTYLHMRAIDNVVFCFTYSRNSLYGPGDGYSTLSRLLADELRDMQLQLKPYVQHKNGNDANCFFIDNEAYRFLVAKKQGYNFPNVNEREYESSWDKSAKQIEQMMAKFMSITPHRLQDTITLNVARKMILQLAEPMVQIQATIDKKIADITEGKEILIAKTNDKKTLEPFLNIELEDLEVNKLKEPATVCFGNNCKETIIVGGLPKINYFTRCHDPCHLKGVEANIVGDPILSRCAAMDGKPTCQNCGCRWETHMHHFCEYNKVMKPTIDPDVKSKIDNIEKFIERKSALIQYYETLVAEYEHEKHVIGDVCSKFAYVLTSNSKSPYNRFIEPYILLLIEEEKKKMDDVKDRPQAVYNSLIKMKEAHQEKVKILEKAIENKSQAKIGLQDIVGYREELFKLKHYGHKFRTILGIISEQKKQEFAHTEHAVVYFQKYYGPLSAPFSYTPNNKTKKTVTGKVVKFFKAHWKKKEHSDLGHSEVVLY